MANTLSSIADKAPRLIKKTRDRTFEELPISIVDSELFDGEDVLKTRIHETIGNQNVYEFIGIGGIKIRFKLYFETISAYDDFYTFVSDGSSFVIACSFLPEYVVFKIDGNIQKQISYKGAVTATIALTDALNPNVDEVELALQAGFILDSPLAETSGNKISALQSLKDFAKNTFDFVSNSNQKIGGFTNTVAVYSAAITNVFQGLAATSSIITNPINAIKNSATQITGGISGFISAMQNAVTAIKQVPSDIENMIDLFSQIGDQLNNLFDLGNSNDNLKYNSTFLQSTATTLMQIENNPSQEQEKLAIAEYSSPNAAAEYFLTTINNQNREVISVLVLTSILLTLYENAENIDKWNSVDLEKLRKNTEIIYNFITSKGIDNALQLQLLLARNRFFKLFKILLKQSLKVVKYSAIDQEFLSDIVYRINGNFDYYNETKQLNNIIGSIVEEGDIFVISND